MSITVRRTAAALAAVGALSLGGAAIAGAASNGSPSGRAAHGHDPHPALAADVAAKVKAAAIAKVRGATVLRTEAGGPDGAAYHAHVKTSDGTLRVVLVDASFAATAVQADEGRGPAGPGDRGDHRHGARRPG